MQFAKYGKNEFTYYGKGMGKHRDFPYSSLPLTFRVNPTHNIPIFWECTISHKMAIFCGKPCHSQVVGFRSYYKTQIIHGVTVMQNFIRWEYYGKKLIYSHIMGFEYKYIEFKNPHNSQI